MILADGRSMVAVAMLWSVGGSILFLLVPQVSPVLVLMSPLLPFAWHRAAEGRLPWHWPSSLVATLLAAAIYLLANASWSQSPGSAAFANR
jgi:hypothetical protein